MSRRSSQRYLVTYKVIGDTSNFNSVIGNVYNFFWYVSEMIIKVDHKVFLQTLRNTSSKCITKMADCWLAPHMWGLTYWLEAEIVVSARHYTDQHGTRQEVLAAHK